MVDHQREDRTPPLSGVMGVGRQQQCPEVMWPCCFISEKGVAEALKVLKLGKQLVLLVW